MLPDLKNSEGEGGHLNYIILLALKSNFPFEY